MLRPANLTDEVPMFNGEQSTSIASDLPEEQFYQRVEQSLKKLGRVKISSKGSISIEPKDSIMMMGFLTDAKMDGSVKKRSNGEYEIVVNYSLAPSMLNWILAVVLFCTTVVGAAIIIAPLIEKSKFDSAVKDAFRDLEEDD